MFQNLWKTVADSANSLWVHPTLFSRTWGLQLKGNKTTSQVGKSSVCFPPPSQLDVQFAWNKYPSNHSSTNRRQPTQSLMFSQIFIYWVRDFKFCLLFLLNCANLESYWTCYLTFHKGLPSAFFFISPPKKKSKDSPYKMPYRSSYVLYQKL